MYSTIAAAALLALAPTALAGSLIINNHCSQNVYMFANQGFNDTSAMMTLSPGGAPYSVPMSGQSVVVKMHSDPDPGSINSELEYSVVGSTLFYDLSNILGLPQLFSTNGMTVQPSDSSCTSLNCVPGASSCAGAYVNSDDPDTLSCGAATNLVVNLCSANQGSSAPASSAAPAASAPPPPPPAPAAPKVSAPAPSAVAPVVNVVASAAPSSKAPAPAPAPAAASPSPAAVAAVAPAAAAAAGKSNGHPLIVNPNGMISALGLTSSTATRDVEADVESNAPNVAVVTTFTTLYTRAEATPAPVQRRHVHHHNHFHADEE